MAASKKRKRTIAIILPILALCAAFVILLITVLIPNGKYNSALELLSAGKYEEAMAAFTALGGYKDSEAQIAKCETAIQDAKYAAAAALYDAGKYEEAIAAFTALGGYQDSEARIAKCETAIKDEKYNAAVALIETGDILNAYDRLIALEGYRDSAQKASEIFDQYKIAKLQAATAGRTVYFGAYEQDNDLSNGKETIRWIVLLKENDRVLVLSRFALDFKPYNTSGESVTWENCSLRKWLNGTFLRAAFSEEERAMIPSVRVPADENSQYATDPGESTEDQIFLLSETEGGYLGSSLAQQCMATDYCAAQGAELAGDGTCGWWLRTPGKGSNYAMCIRSNGSPNHSGAPVEGENAVRPAMWISLE